MPAKSKSNEINIIRIYEAPVKTVWMPGLTLSKQRSGGDLVVLQ
jgi:hypothetical protein